MSNINKLYDEIVKLSITDLLELKQLFEANGINMTASVAASTEENKSSVKEEKTSWTLKIKSYPAAAKITLITKIKNVLGLASLADAKKIAETPNAVIKDNISKEEAQKIITELGIADLVTEIV